MSIHVANLSDENLHRKSFSIRHPKGGIVTVWRYTTWEPMLWYYRTQRDDGDVAEGQTFTYWGAKTEAIRYLGPNFKGVFTHDHK